jgi:outer membrane protein TolC
MLRSLSTWLAMVGLVAGAGSARAQDTAKSPVTIPSPPSILGPEVRPIDLNTALRLAGVENPELNLARQRVVEAAAFRMFAAAQILPTLNAGTNYDSHTGVLQQSDGNILSVQRSAIYVGSGANAIGSGTVNIPGVFLGGNIATGIYAYLSSRQVVVQREFASIAVRNQVFLQVALAYSEGVTTGLILSILPECSI